MIVIVINIVISNAIDIVIVIAAATDLHVSSVIQRLILAMVALARTETVGSVEMIEYARHAEPTAARSATGILQQIAAYEALVVGIDGIDQLELLLPDQFAHILIS